MKRMGVLTTVGWVVLCASPSMLFAQEKTFPTDEEINLVVAQAERAFDKYDLDLTQQDSSSPELQNAKDHEVVAAWRKLLPTLKRNPQAFNGPLGHVFVVTLDDASRNAALSSGQALANASQMLLAINAPNKAQQMSDARESLSSGQTAQSDSLLLYSVSESADALYERFLDANGDLEQKLAEAFQQCRGALDQQSKSK